MVVLLTLNYICVCCQDELYLCMGKIIALSILHGGPGPVFFAPSVVDYLFGGFSAVSPSILDVPNEELQLKINKVLTAHACRDFWQKNFCVLLW